MIIILKEEIILGHIVIKDVMYLIFFFFIRFAHFLTHEKDLRASLKIMEDVKRYHEDMQRYLKYVFKIYKTFVESSKTYLWI